MLKNAEKHTTSNIIFGLNFTTSFSAEALRIYPKCYVYLFLTQTS